MSLTEPGLYRIGKNSQIMESDYNFDEECIGIYRIKVPVPFVEEWHRKRAPLREYYLYDEMASSPDALAVYSANNTYVCTIYNHAIVYRNIYDRLDIMTFGLDKHISNLQSDVIGWQRTVNKYLSVPMAPYSLTGIQGNMAFIEGKWVTIEPYSKNIYPEDYREMIKRNCIACYRDTNNVLRFIGGE